jgi:hypothetical protein
MTDFSIHAMFERYAAAMQSLFGDNWRNRKLTRNDKVKLTWRMSRDRFWSDVRRYGPHVTYPVPTNPYASGPDAKVSPTSTIETCTFSYDEGYLGDPDRINRIPAYEVRCDGQVIATGALR